MFADFNKAFFNDNENDTIIPREILNSLGENLPEGFKYIEIERGIVGITPTDTDSEIKVSGFNNIDVNDEVFKEFKPANIYEVSEFLYRTQRSYQAKLTNEDSIIINGTKLGVNQIIKKPFGDSRVKVSTVTIVPQPFQKPFEIELEGFDFKKKVLIKREPLPDMEKSLFKSQGKNAFDISYLINEKTLRLQFNFKLNIDVAENVEEVIETVKLYQSCLKGDIKLNGKNILKSEVSHSEELAVDEMINLWEKVLKIERNLNIKFKPQSEIYLSDLECIEKLYRTLIERKPFKEYVNINELTLSGADIEAINDLVDAEGLSISFYSESILELFSTKIELYGITSYFDFKIKAYQFLEENNSFVLATRPLDNRKIYQSVIYFKESVDRERYDNDLKVLQHAEILKLY